MKWLEDELELNALHNPGSRRGSGNEKAAVVQRAALSAALGGRVDVAAMGSISGSCDVMLIFYIFNAISLPYSEHFFFFHSLLSSYIISNHLKTINFDSLSGIKHLN